MQRFSMPLFATARQDSFKTGTDYLFDGRFDPWERKPVRDFKAIFTEVSRAVGNANGGDIPADLIQNLHSRFRKLLFWLHDMLDDPTACRGTARKELGRLIQQELLPVLMLTDTARRIYTKPRGYAGDFYTIEMIYQNHASGRGKIGELIDRLFLDTPAAQAVRNRRGLMVEEIQRTIDSCSDGPARVCSIASGPAREVLDVYEALPDPSRLHTTLLDMDEQALEFVKQRVTDRSLDGQVHLINENVVHLAIGRRQRSFKPQDLVYSIGLIDYFNDKTVIRLLNWIHRILKPGGRVILGNFHPHNHTRALMDHILEWKLIHRTQEDMNRLFRKSNFGRKCSSIRFESEGINLFAECVKT